MDWVFVMNLIQFEKSPEAKNKSTMHNVDEDFIQFTPLHSGITLVTMDCMLENPVSISFIPPPETIGIGFSLSGSMNSSPEGWGSNISFDSGLSHFSYFPSADELDETFSEGRLRRVCLMMPMDLLQKYMAHYTKNLSPSLEIRHTEPTHLTSPITPGMRAVISQIFECPHQGISHDFFIESKVMELLAYKFKQLGLHTRKDRISLSSKDVDGVVHAASLLTENLDTPKGLDQIARAVGMCRSKLHETFREMYGMTPFEYQRDYRLDIAKQHLLDSSMNITEIAFAVGYSSSGHFTKAFKKRYGELPGKYRRQ
ncbi:AraC family transcriptional regulator [Marinifilum sp. JC120]|nr:AraC family transcriptional regulator [Marinifilum sp. JC120]